MKRLSVILPLVLLVSFGCASVPFVKATQEYAAAAKHLKTYATADTTLDTVQKADLVTAADTLDGAAKAKIVTLGSVKEAWAPVRAPLQIYYGADAKLDDNERGLRIGNLERFDKLIAAENNRWIYPGVK